MLSRTRAALVATALSLIPFSAHAEIDDGLIGYWPLDGDLLSPVNERSGEMDGFALDETYEEGKFGQAIVLDYFEQQRIVITGGEEDDFDFPGGSVSISAWFRVDGFDQGWQALVAKGEGQGWRVARNGGNTQGMSYSGGGTFVDDLRFTQSVNDGEIHHIVAITDGVAGESRLYYDGALIDSGVISEGMTDRANRMMIGGNPDTGGDANGAYRTWNGLIDDVAIWDRPLTGAEIANIWNDGQGAAVSELLAPPDSDDDGIPDFYEDANEGLDRNNPDDAAEDIEPDGLTNLQEFQKGTNPNVADTDLDGLLDGVETGTKIWVNNEDTGTDPLDGDSDNDSLSDGVEDPGLSFEDENQPGTDPNKVDSDADSFSDSEELDYGTDPTLIASIPGPEIAFISYYPFDSDFDDYGPGQYHGFDIFDDIEFSGGKFGNGIQLTGLGQYVEVDDPARELAFVGSSMSVSAWFKVDQFFDTNQNFIAKGDSGRWRIQRRGDTDSLAFSGGSPFAETPGEQDILDEQLHHLVAVSRFGRETELWIDGVLVETGAPPSLVTSADPVAIGGNPNQESASFEGLIDEVGIWGRALTPEEIAVLYNSGEGTTVADFVGLEIEPPPSNNFQITSIVLEGGTEEITIVFNSDVGANYEIDYSTDLSSFDGTVPGGPFNADSTSTTVSFENPVPSASKIFFRVSRQ